MTIEQKTEDQNTFLRERELAARWKKSKRTLQRWRAEGYGPAYILIGGSVRYPLTDILEFEDRTRRSPAGDMSS